MEEKDELLYMGVSIILFWLALLMLFTLMQGTDEFHHQIKMRIYDSERLQETDYREEERNGFLWADG